MEGKGSGGPYAFDRLEDAVSAQIPGLDYSAPEFFTGRFWSTEESPNEVAEHLIELCRSVFKPVIVKLSGTPSDIDKYIANLWHYLYIKYLKEDLEPNFYTFNGGGHPISPERIISLILLEI